MRLARSILPIVAAAAIAVGLTACGGDDAGESAGAGGDKSTLTIYSGRDEAFVGPLVEAFEKESPDAKIKVRYGDSAELAATIREEGDRSPADAFFSQDAGALGALQAEGLLAKLPDATLGKVDKAYRSTAGDWVGTSGRVRVLAYDHRKLAESDLPASVFDLTKPAWKGKVGWAPTNASFQSFITAMRKTEGEDRTRAWLEGMQANGARAYEKNGVIRDAIASGEIEVGLINHYYVLEAIKEGEADGETYPVKLHFFPGGDIGSLVNVAGVGILKSAKHGDLAQRFADFLLATPQQKYFADETSEYPLADAVPQDPSLPALGDIQQPEVDLADLADLKGTLALLQDAGVL
ncbi:MAG: iron ABC transporter substrate-binding protein [Solirubrobacteraceae bacterium]|nr:iron ABC transporter substrate-binding protein [Solirubrobacteraceae bacterium]